MTHHTDHLGEREFHRCPVCVDAETVRQTGLSSRLAIWLSAVFAAASYGLLLALN